MALIIAAVPFFFLLIFIELAVDKKRGTGYYQFNDGINSLNLGVLSRVSGIVLALIPLSAYVWLYNNYGYQGLNNDHWAVMALAFVAYDLGYYWVHRLSHRINIMWSSHVVHHSSEEFNLTTALRQSSTPALFAFVIYLPMALVGVSPELAVTCGALNLIYQFWVHTRHIDRMPQWFETVFVTPSHHRVHHALNKDYIDKNYGGVFILWDKLFASFQQEKDEAPVVYGVSVQLKSWNPLWANFQIYRNVLFDAWHTKAWGDKVKTLFSPPGWRAQDMKQAFPRQYVSSKRLVKFDVTLTLAMKRYIITQFALFVALVFVAILFMAQFSLPIVIGLCVLIGWHCFAMGALQEARAWTKWGEPIRVISAGSGVLMVTYQPSMYVIPVIVGVVTAINLLWFKLVYAEQFSEDVSDLASTESA